MRKRTLSKPRPVGRTGRRSRFSWLRSTGRSNQYRRNRVMRFLSEGGFKKR